MEEHKQAAEKGKWSHSGITQHKEQCHQPVDWDNPEVLATMKNKNKKKLVFGQSARGSQNQEEPVMTRKGSQ
jgi:hypothetical protein